MNTVLRFTLLQQLKSRTYQIATVVIALLLIVVSAGTLVFIQKMDKSELKSDIDYVYVCDNSALSGADYNAMKNSGDVRCEQIEFISYSGSLDEACQEAALKSTKAVAVEINGNEKDGFDIKIVTPEKFELSKTAAEVLSIYFENNLRYVIYEQNDFGKEQLEELLMETEISMSVAGEDSASEDEEMAKMFIPAIFGIVLYMMLCIYGQGIARSTVLEKDSKVMETILVITKPYSLIFGKLLGFYFAAIMQFSLWVISLITGLFVGKTLTSSMSAGESVGESVFLFINKFANFSVLSVLISIFAFLIGFLLFASLASLFGSFASKTEEINSSYGIYTMIVVFSWMFPYINGISGNEHLMSILRYIPFSASFTISADILIGNISVGNAAISLLIMLTTTIIIIFLAAKIYKALVLYRGNSIKPKDIINIIKNK